MKILPNDSTIVQRWNNRTLFSLLWPLIIEQILAVTMGTVDTIMVSYEGDSAISAVNIIDQINNLLIIAFTALSTGGAVVVSQYIGRKDHANTSVAAKQLVYIVTVFSLFIMIIAMFFRYNIIYLFYGKIPLDVLDGAGSYFLITSLSYPFLAIYNANAALYRSIGNSKLPMRITILINILNIGGNALFIFGMKMGVTGAALSTFLSRVIAALITVLLLYRDNTSPISIAGILKIRIVRSMVKNILYIGIPNGMESSLFMLGKLLTQRLFTIFGTEAMAANAIVSLINSFSFMPGNAFGLALLTVVGQCAGAGDYREAKKQTLKIMKYAYITLGIINIAIYILMEPIIGLFMLSAEAQSYAIVFLQVHCISIALGWALSFTLPNALRAAGDVRFVMISASISMWIVRVSASYLFVYLIGPLGVWLAMAADFFVRGMMYYLRWTGDRWMEKRVIRH
ncbi:MAG: MATE family efflux transporter [Treponema sp.]|nr:MATE family efflux transporter [Treponema sp.]